MMSENRARPRAASRSRLRPWPGSRFWRTRSTPASGVGPASGSGIAPASHSKYICIYLYTVPAKIVNFVSLVLFLAVNFRKFLKNRDVSARNVTAPALYSLCLFSELCRIADSIGIKVQWNEIILLSLDHIVFVIVTLRPLRHYWHRAALNFRFFVF